MDRKATNQGALPLIPHFIFCLDTKNEAKKIKAAKNFVAKLAARKAAQPNSRLNHKNG